MWLLEQKSGYSFAGIEVDGVLYVDTSEIEHFIKVGKGETPEFVKSPVQSCPWGDIYGFTRCLPDVPIFNVTGSLHGGLMVEQEWFIKHIGLEFTPTQRPSIYPGGVGATQFYCYEEDDDWRTLVKGYPPLGKLFALEDETGIPF